MKATYSYCVDVSVQQQEKKPNAQKKGNVQRNLLSSILVPVKKKTSKLALEIMHGWNKSVAHWLEFWDTI